MDEQAIESLELTQDSEIKNKNCPDKEENVSSGQGSSTKLVRNNSLLCTNVSSKAMSNNKLTPQRHAPIVFDISSPNKIASNSSSSSNTAAATSSTLLNDPMNNVTNVATATSSTLRICYLCNFHVHQKNFLSHILGSKHKKARKTNKQIAKADKRTLQVSGVDRSASHSEIVECYYDFGLIDAFPSKYQIQLLFKSEEACLAALQSKCVTSSGVRLKAKAIKFQTETINRSEKPDAASIVSPEIRAELSKVAFDDSTLDHLVNQLIADIELTRREYRHREDIVRKVENFIRREFSRAQCYVFGSSANSLGFKGSDVDLYAYLNYDPYDTPIAADGMNAAADLTMFLTKGLRQQRWVRKASPIPRARVPIVKFEVDGVEVDLSFRNGMPLQNTFLIKLFNECHPLVRRYMMIVRFWAKVHDISGGGKPQSHITNYALTMLMAFVIMRGRCIIPTVVDLRQHRYNRVIINGWDCGFSEKVDKYVSQNHDCTPIDLALEFFDFYSTLETDEYVICPLVGELIRRTHMANKSSSQLPPDLRDYIRARSNLQTDTPLCVQDPFDLAHNVTRGLKLEYLTEFQNLCRKSAEIIRRVKNQRCPLWALFESPFPDENLEQETEMITLSDDNDKDMVGQNQNGVKDNGVIEVEMADENEIKEINVNNEDEIKEINVNNEDEIKEINVNNEDEIKEINVNNEDEIKEINVNNEDEIKEINVNNEDEIKEINVNNEDEIKEINVNKDDEIKAIHVDNEDEVKSSSNVSVVVSEATVTLDDRNYLEFKRYQFPKWEMVVAFSNLSYNFCITDMETGAISYRESPHTCVTIRAAFLKFLEFFFLKVYLATSLLQTNISDELSYPPDSSKYIAKFEATGVKFWPKSLKNKVFYASGLSHDEPFRRESNIAKELVKNHQTSHRSLDVKFFVCHSQSEINRFTLIPYIPATNFKQHTFQDFRSSFKENLLNCIQTSTYLTRKKRIPLLLDS